MIRRKNEAQKAASLRRPEGGFGGQAGGQDGGSSFARRATEDKQDAGASPASKHQPALKKKAETGCLSS